MANPHRGEAAIEINGAAYTLVFTINSICEAEAITRLPVHMIVEQLQRGYMSAVRVLIWAGLRARHGEKTLEEAGDIAAALIADHGPEAAGDILGKTLAGAFPEPKKSADAGGKKGAAGSGKNS